MQDTREAAKAPCAVHVDLDGATEIYRGHGWPYPYKDDPIFTSGLRNCLAFFEENGIKATLFTVASSLDDPAKRELLEEAVDRGHEIASHSLTHRYLVDLNSDQKWREVAESRERLEQLPGVKVRGFRAPGYRIDLESLELLDRAGYGYDSSAFPTESHAALLGMSTAQLMRPSLPLPGGSLIELPLPDYRPLPFPFSPSYAHLLGTGLFRWGVRRAAQRGVGMVLLFHLVDLADPLPNERLRAISARIFTISMMSADQKRGRCQTMLDRAQRHFQIVPTARVLEEELAVAV